MIQNYTPPPPEPVPAEIQNIDAAHAERLNASEQIGEGTILQGENGAEFTVSSSNAQAQSLNESLEGIGASIGGLGEAQRQGQEVSALNNALQGPGYTDRPVEANSTNEGIDNFRSQTANSQSNDSLNATQPSQNSGIEEARERMSDGNSMQSDSPVNEGISAEGGMDAVSDSGMDVSGESGIDVGGDSGIESGSDSGMDASSDGGIDVGSGGGMDMGGDGGMGME